MFFNFEFLSSIFQRTLTYWSEIVDNNLFSPSSSFRLDINMTGILVSLPYKLRLIELRQKKKKKKKAHSYKLLLIDSNLFQFIPVVLDLGVASKAEMEAALKSSFGGEGLPQPSRVLLFHNAGTLGNLKYLKDLVDQQHVQQYFNLNIW